MGLVAYAGEDITDKPFRRRTALELGYTQDFIKQARLAARQRAAEIELNERGLIKFRRLGMPEWARKIITEMCEKHQVFADDIASKSRRHKVVRARNEAMYLIKMAKPSLSSPQIANWFDRDHVTILYSIASHGHAANLPKLVGYDVEKSRKSRRERMAQLKAERRRVR